MATSPLRDFGFTLGPAFIGAIALSRAAAEFTPELSASGLSAGARAAAGQAAAEGGPLAVDSVPPSSSPGGAVPSPWRPLRHPRLYIHRLDIHRSGIHRLDIHRSGI